MLHDPKWHHGTLDGLITWLEGQPRETAYRFCNAGDCLMHRYMGSRDTTQWPLQMQKIYLGEDKHRIALGRGFLDEQTYGSALERAYKARAVLVTA